jgi:micrococcal nuclease
MYEYKAMITSVVDGDTVHLDVDLGCDTHTMMTVRLASIDAPEMNTDAGKTSKSYLMSILPPGNVVWLRTVKDRREKYGRYLGYLYRTQASMEAAAQEAMVGSLNEAMVNGGQARIYLGGPR